MTTAWCDSPSRWLSMAPSDECTVNEIREAGEEDEAEQRQYSRTVSNTGSEASGGLTQVSVKVHALSTLQTSGDSVAPNHFGGIATPTQQAQAQAQEATVAVATTATTNTRSPATASSPGHGSKPICPRWSQMTAFVHRMILGFVVTLSVHAARNPKTYVTGVIMLSLGLITLGFFTNFAINTDEQEIYAPFNSRTKDHGDWISNESGFPGKVRVFTANFHNHGDNILGYEHMLEVFEVLDSVRATPGYDQVCAQGDYVNFDDVTTCKVMSFTRFFKHDVARMEKVYNATGEEGVIEAISADSYENLTPVDTDMLLGNLERDESGVITSTQSFKIYFLIPIVEGAKELEGLILDKMFLLKEEWDTDDSSSLELEFFAMR